MTVYHFHGILFLYLEKKVGGLLDEQEKFILDSLSNFKYKNNSGVTKEIDVKKLLFIDKRNLPFDSLPATYLFISSIADKWRLKVENLKADLDALQGELRNKYVNDKILRAQNEGKKPPESMLTAAVLSNEDYIKLVKKYNKAKYAWRIAEHLVKACEQKASLMQTISAEQREQLKIAPHGNNIRND